MRLRAHKAAAFLSLLALPVLGGCDDTQFVGPENPDPQNPELLVRPDFIALAPGETFQLDLILLDRGDRIRPPAGGLVWTSTDEKIVRPLEDGWIEALCIGEAMVSVAHRDWVADVWVMVTEEKRPLAGVRH